MSYFMAKVHQIRFPLGSTPDPTGGDYSDPPDTLAVFKGPTSKGREEEGEGCPLPQLESLDLPVLPLKMFIQSLTSSVPLCLCYPCECCTTYIILLDICNMNLELCLLSSF